MRDHFRIIDIDAEKEVEIAVRYKVRNVPTLILFGDGRELSRRNGFQSVGMLREWLTPYIAGYPLLVELIPR